MKRLSLGLLSSALVLVISFDRARAQGGNNMEPTNCDCVCVAGKISEQQNFWSVPPGRLCRSLNTTFTNKTSCDVGGREGTLQRCQQHIDRPPNATSSWDLVSLATDDNKLLKNPEWLWQKTGGTPMNLEFCLRTGSFLCSHQNVTIDTGVLPDDLVCKQSESQVGIDGHVNWFDATYEGTLTWDENPIDHDYNFYMDPFSVIGRLHPEFNSDETIDNFTTPWWKGFHDNHPAKGTVLGFTIMTGLVGLDCEHDCKVEVHPVHAIAIRVKEDRSDETWAIFVRNWGNEGFCSSHQHYLDLDGGSYTFRLPWNTDPLGSVTVGGATSFLTNVAGVTGPIVVPQRPGFPHFAQGGVLVTFLLPPPEQGAIVHGELHLQWTGPVSNQVIPPASPQPLAAWSLTVPTVAVTQQQQESIVEAEDKIGTLVAQMSPAQRQIYLSKTSRPISPHTLTVRSGTPANVPTIAHAPRLRHVTDAKKAVVDQTQRDALCAAYANNVPGFPKLCPAPSQ